MSKSRRQGGNQVERRALYCGVVVLLIVAFSFVAPLLCQHDAELANLALSNRFVGALHSVPCANGTAYHGACCFGGCGIERCYRFDFGCVVRVYRRRIRFCGNAHH